MAGDLMSTQRIEFETYSLETPTARKVRAVEPTYTISMSTRVHAETRRLFQALVVPEYLETWLRIPDEGVSWSLIPMEPAQGFVLECANPKPFRIFAGYTTWRRRRLSIRWRLERNRLIKESSVALRLIGDFEYSVLSLCHTGLGSLEELTWHRRFWTESLESLSRLFQRISSPAYSTERA